MKKVALISTFCNTPEKINIFLENVKTIKSLGIDVLALGPNSIILPDEVIKECNYFFYTNENPLLSWPVRQYTHWYSIKVDENKLCTFHRGFSDYGWAALYQTKKLSQIALTYDYDVFYHMIYDLEINDKVKEKFLSNEINVLHPRIDPLNPEFIWETTLHFMIFDRDLTSKIVDEINLDNYLKMNSIAEDHVRIWKNKFNIKISDLYVKDLIYYWKNHNFFDYEIHSDFKFFISKNPEMEIWLGTNQPYSQVLTNNIRMVFYEIKSQYILEHGVNISINGNTYHAFPKDFEILEIPISSLDVNDIEIIFNDQKINITNEYKNISFNQIYYNYIN